MRKLLKKIGFLLFAVTLAMPAFANNLLERQPLVFGTIAISGAFPQDITLTPYGTESHSAGITPLRGYSSGIFDITQMTPSTSFGVVVNDTAIYGPGSTAYDVVDFTFAPDISNGQSAADGITMATSDGAGNLTLKIGATLKIQSGTTYVPGAYRGTYQLVLVF